jgi:putative tryptophan/tyrosine transport system substrate-binding protein
MSQPRQPRAGELRKRRHLLLVCGSAVVFPLTAAAQPKPKLPRIGALITSGSEAFLSEFRKGLADFGWAEGKNIELEIRSADGNASLLPGLAHELVRLKVDIIVASLTPAVFAARAATTAIPIVMAPAGAPLEVGLVADLARPGGNITGFAAAGPQMGEKLSEYIRAFLPSARRVAFLANPNDPFAAPFGTMIERGGQKMGLAVQTIPVRDTAEFDAAFAAMASAKAEAVIIQPSLPWKVALDLASKKGLPSFSIITPFARAGGLLAYSGVQLFARAGYYVDRILKGQKPANLAVEQPSRYELTINLKTAKALGLTVPPLLLAQADEVIE